MALGCEIGICLCDENESLRVGERCDECKTVVVESVPITHAPDCIGLHTSCDACGNDSDLNVCVSDFGAPELCEMHRSEAK
jgi:hypothetical protein